VWRGRIATPRELVDLAVFWQPELRRITQHLHPTAQAYSVDTVTCHVHAAGDNRADSIHAATMAVTAIDALRL